MIGVDVVIAVCAVTDRRNDRCNAAFQQIEKYVVTDRSHRARKAHIYGGMLHLRGEDQPSVYPTDAQRIHAACDQVPHQPLVDRAAQHHFDDR